MRPCLILYPKTNSLWVNSCGWKGYDTNLKLPSPGELRLPDLGVSRIGSMKWGRKGSLYTALTGWGERLDVGRPGVGRVMGNSLEGASLPCALYPEGVEGILISKEPSASENPL